MGLSKCPSACVVNEQRRAELKLSTKLHGVGSRKSPAFEHRKGWGSLSCSSANGERLGHPPPEPHPRYAAGRTKRGESLIILGLELGGRSIRYVGKETDRKWEEGDEISILEFKTTEYGRSKKIIPSEEIKKKILEIGINKCARKSGFDRKNFIRKLIRGIPVKRNSYGAFVHWIQSYQPQ